jgi:hypothetical protein
MNLLKNNAEAALRQLEEAIEGLLEQHPDGLTNAEIARELGIETGSPGEHRNMLSWSIVGRLVRSGRIERVTANRKVVLRIARQPG